MRQLPASRSTVSPKDTVLLAHPRVQRDAQTESSPGRQRNMPKVSGWKYLRNTLLHHINQYRPVNLCQARGISAERPSEKENATQPDPEKPSKKIHNTLCINNLQKNNRPCSFSLSQLRTGDLRGDPSAAVLSTEGKRMGTPSLITLNLRRGALPMVTVRETISSGEIAIFLEMC